MISSLAFSTIWCLKINVSSLVWTSYWKSPYSRTYRRVDPALLEISLDGDTTKSNRDGLPMKELTKLKHEPLVSLANKIGF